MIVYHGTTGRRAERIALEGFLPKKPSRGPKAARMQAGPFAKRRT